MSNGTAIANSQTALAEAAQLCQNWNEFTLKNTQREPAISAIAHDFQILQNKINFKKNVNSDLINIKHKLKHLHITL